MLVWDKKVKHLQGQEGVWTAVKLRRYLRVDNVATQRVLFFFIIDIISEEKVGFVLLSDLIFGD